MKIKYAFFHILTDLMSWHTIFAMTQPIPADIQRFILTSIHSIPHLEAILLFRKDPAAAWDAKMMAQNLYVSEKKAMEILKDLCESGFITLKNGHTFNYYPVSQELKGLVDRLADVYSKNLLEATRLIHSKINQQAKQFGDAFKLESET
jgi:hypothetical protein